MRAKSITPTLKEKSTNSAGLGLSLANDIVKAHGGELRVVTKDIEGLPADLSVRNAVKAEVSTFDKSSVDKSAEAGSEFIIQLPIK